MDVNIGTSEEPVYVPAQALEPESGAGKEWWEMLAVGSITLTDAQLDALLMYLQSQDK